MDALQHQLQHLVFTFWKTPEREGKALVRALLTSPCSRAVTLRHQLVIRQMLFVTPDGVQEADGMYVFHEKLTPAFVVSMLEDLRSVGALSRAQIRAIENAVLDRVSSTGRWKSHE